MQGFRLVYVPMDQGLRLVYAGSAMGSAPRPPPSAGPLPPVPSLRLSFSRHAGVTELRRPRQWFPFGASPPELKQWLAAIAAAVAAKAALGNSRNQFFAVAGRLHLEHNTGSV